MKQVQTIIDNTIKITSLHKQTIFLFNLLLIKAMYITNSMYKKMQNTDSGHQLNTDFVNNNTEHRFSMPNTERVLYIQNGWHHCERLGLT